MLWISDKRFTLEFFWGLFWFVALLQRLLAYASYFHQFFSTGKSAMLLSRFPGLFNLITQFISNAKKPRKLEIPKNFGKCCLCSFYKRLHYVIDPGKQAAVTRGSPPGSSEELGSQGGQ